MIDFIGDSHLRGTFATPERASYYQFRTGAGRLLIVAWHAGRWTCVEWHRDAPAKPTDDEEAEDMLDAERRAAAMWAERQAARNARSGLRLVA